MRKRFSLGKAIKITGKHLKHLLSTKKADCLRYANTEMAYAQDVNVAALIVAQHEKERQENEICFMAILDSIEYLAHQGLARGETQAESNLVGFGKETETEGENR